MSGTTAAGPRLALDPLEAPAQLSPAPLAAVASALGSGDSRGSRHRRRDPRTPRSRRALGPWKGTGPAALRSWVVFFRGRGGRGGDDKTGHLAPKFR